MIQEGDDSEGDDSEGDRDDFTEACTFRVR